MSDIDDLLDDFDKGELVKPTRTTTFARQTSNKLGFISLYIQLYRSNTRDEENRVNSRNELEFLEEIMEQYGDNDIGLLDSNGIDSFDIFSSEKSQRTPTKGQAR